MNPLQLLSWLVPVLLIGLAASAGGQEPPIPGNDYRRVNHDGAWCWFADPRAVHANGTTYIGGVNSQGDIFITAYNEESKTIENAILHRRLERDDHANPAILVLPDGRLRAFYSKHSDSVMRTRITLEPGDISVWSDEVALALNNPDELRPNHPNAVCYANPMLIDGGSTVALFWRGTNWKPCIAFSKDGGATFTTSRVMFESPGAGAGNRPYLKAACRDGETIHLAFTTGHPRNESRNSVYYASFDGETFRRADGSVIGTLDDLPLDPAKCDFVYDASITNERAWIWDIAADASGDPAIAYTRLPDETRHVYHYAAWSDGAWRDARIVDAGAWFPATPSGQVEREPHYSAGVVLDHDDPRAVFLSRPIGGVFEIERWITNDHGASWTHHAITRDSDVDNVRPVAVRNASHDGPHVVWMRLDFGYEHYTRYRTSLRMDVPEPTERAVPMTADAILAQMERLGRWQIEHPSSHALTDWTHGALYAGMMALVRQSDDPRFAEAMLEVGRRTDWKPGPRELMADDHAVGQMYLEMFERERDAAMLEPIRRAMDHVIAQPAEESLEWVNNIHNREWAWCDALFMAPPVLTRLYRVTGETKYLDELDRRWWKTTDYLYDKEEHLYFRDSRYFDQREANGEKIFWSRGNGWVIAGLARVLQDLAANHATRRRYETLFREMAMKIASLQGDDGLWRSSLLDPASYPKPETSGSGFFCFALAWGINAGLLDEETFRPVVERAWAGLNRCVDANGRLGWVQPIGADPRAVREEHTEIYGVGAFLLAGEQMIRLVAPTE